MNRTASVLLGTAMLAGAVPITLYGLFAILYRGDESTAGDPYIKINGSEVDSDVVGVIAFSIAALAIVLSIVLLKRLTLIGFGVIALSLGSLSGVLGIWLVATPDPDGGRQAVGAMLTAFAAGMVLLAGALTWAYRRRTRVQART